MQLIMTLLNNVVWNIFFWTLILYPPIACTRQRQSENQEVVINIDTSIVRLPNHWLIGCHEIVIGMFVICLFQMYTKKKNPPLWTEKSHPSTGDHCEWQVLTIPILNWSVLGRKDHLNRLWLLRKWGYEDVIVISPLWRPDGDNCVWLM